MPPSDLVAVLSQPLCSAATDPRHKPISLRHYSPQITPLHRINTWEMHTRRITIFHQGNLCGSAGQGRLREHQSYQVWLAGASCPNDQAIQQIWAPVPETSP